MKQNGLKLAISCVFAAGIMAPAVSMAQGYVFVNNQTQNTAYVGIDAGWTDIGVEANASSNVGGTQIYQNTDSLMMNGLGYRFFGGYRFNINQGFIAFEANLGQDDAEYTAKTNFTNQQLESDLSYGGSVLFGHALSQVNSSVEVYGLVGYQFSDYELLDQTANESQRTEETFSGPRIGVGLQAGVSDNLSVRFQFSRTLHSEETISSLGQTIDLKPSANRFSVGLIGSF